MALETEPGNLQIEIGLWLRTEQDGIPNAATYCAAEQGKGYSAYKALWQGYFTEPDTAYTRDGINKWLGTPDLGLDLDALNTCIDSGKYDDALGAVGQRASDFGVTGTPSVLIATGSDTPVFLSLPDGSQWGGAVPIMYLRQLFKMLLEDGLSVADANAKLFETPAQ